MDDFGFVLVCRIYFFLEFQAKKYIGLTFLLKKKKKSIF